MTYYNVRGGYRSFHLITKHQKDIVLSCYVDCEVVGTVELTGEEYRQIAADYETPFGL